MKRIVIGLLVLLVIMGCFTGCGGQTVEPEATASPMVTETVSPTPTSVSKNFDIDLHTYEKRLIDAGVKLDKGFELYEEVNDELNRYTAFALDGCIMFDAVLNSDDVVVGTGVICNSDALYTRAVQGGYSKDITQTKSFYYGYVTMATLHVSQQSADSILGDFFSREATNLGDRQYIFSLKDDYMMDFSSYSNGADYFSIISNEYQESIGDGTEQTDESPSPTQNDEDGITWVGDITKVTKENVQKIKKGMNIQEAIQILGQPTQVLNGSPYLTYYWDAGSNGVQISNFDLGNVAIVADTNGTIISIESTGLRSEDEGFDSAGRQTIVVPDNISNDDTEANNDDNNYSIYTMILPEASTYSYSANEIMDCIAPWVESGYSISEALRLARNEVFARHGNIFEDAALNQYFYWERSDIFGYEGYQDSESAYAEFNDYELDNIATIKELEKEYK